jgi:hypothetical protein
MPAAAPAIARFTDRRGNDRHRNVSGYFGTAKSPLVSIAAATWVRTRSRSPGTKSFIGLSM